MRNLIALVTLLTLLALGCSGGSGSILSSDFTIRVTGTPGTTFTGTYMAMQADGTSNSHSVEGTTPTEYTVKANTVSVVFQKKAEAGTLRVEVLKGGQVVSESETTAAFGIAQVATR